jgi:hypothetical protein
MSVIKYSIAALACAGLLAIQLSGLHMHVDAAGDARGMHGTHVHQLDPDDHDHSTDIDVSVLEQVSVSWSKLVPLLFTAAILLASVVWRRLKVRAPPEITAKASGNIRWRPPLRAPPISQ